MKKFSVRLTACALSALMLLSLSACGGSASSADSSKAEGISSAVEEVKEDASSVAEEISAAESQEEASSESTTGLPASGKFSSIADFVNSDIMQSQFESMKSSLGGDTMDIDLLGEGNKLIYNFTYLDLDGQDLEALGSALASALDTDSMSSTFSSIASSLKDAVDVDNPLVVVNYLAPDGSTLASKEFAAE